MYRGFSTITSLAQNIYNCKYLLLKAKLIKRVQQMYFDIYYMHQVIKVGNIAKLFGAKFLTSRSSS